MTSPGKILVIEDAEPLRNDIIEMLSFEGFEVNGAENGLIGVDKALSDQPDLIICDIMMPELDGYGVLDTLRKDARTVTIPFVFLTAKTDRTDQRYGMGLGADDYLTKPFVAAELLDTVHARLEKRKTMYQFVDNRIRELSDSIITALPHELRTPLNTIIGFSDMMIMESQRLKPDQVSDWSQHINQAAQRLYRLIENYLLYVRAIVVSKNPEDLQELRASVLHHPGAIVQFHSAQKGTYWSRSSDLVFDVPETESCAVAISDTNLGKIVEEIVDNALKFSPKGSAVTVKAQHDHSWYTITVSDSGRGLSQQQIENVSALMMFDRWIYEDQGIGLGLAIVQRLIDLHEGQIAIESDGKTGTIVTIKLKVVPSEK